MDTAATPRRATTIMLGIFIATVVMLAICWPARAAEKTLVQIQYKTLSDVLAQLSEQDTEELFIRVVPHVAPPAPEELGPMFPQFMALCHAVCKGTLVRVEPHFDPEQKIDGVVLVYIPDE